MKRTDSLKKKKEFRYTYRAGRSYPHRLFTVITAPCRGRESRVGISVSKKIGNSVQRNRAKRRMREAVTPLIPQLRSGANVIFVVRGGVLTEPFSSLGAAMRDTLSRAGLLRRDESRPG